MGSIGSGRIVPTRRRRSNSDCQMFCGEEQKKHVRCVHKKVMNKSDQVTFCKGDVSSFLYFIESAFCLSSVKRGKCPVGLKVQFVKLFPQGS